MPPVDVPYLRANPIELPQSNPPITPKKKRSDGSIPKSTLIQSQPIVQKVCTKIDKTE